MSSTETGKTAAPLPRRTRAARLPAEKRREKIVAAATKAFASRSFREVGMAEIAAEAGVSEPTIYRYFDSKRALYLAILDQVTAGLLASWGRIAANTPSPLEALRQVGAWYFFSLMENPQPALLRARAMVETGDAEVAERTREHFRDTFQFVHALYEKAKDQSLVAPSTDPHAHSWLFMSLGALLDRMMLNDLDGRPDLDQMRQILMMIEPVVLAPERAARPSSQARKLKRSRNVRPQ